MDVPKKICVTGAAGVTGRVTVRELLEHGYQVVATDLPPEPAELAGAHHRARLTYTRADLADYGDTVEILAGVDGVVHLANIPAPGLFTPAHTFTANTRMNSNVFLAAAQVGLSRVVWASSETTLGLDFEVPPRYAPLDEGHYPLPTSTYSLSKVVAETMAAHISSWSGIPFVALRLSNVIRPEAYAQFPSFWDDPALRKWNLWSYIDVRDAALACRLALEANVEGASSYLIAASDTVMTTPSSELMAATFPGVPITRPLKEFETLQAIDRARDALGFQPRHSWRDHVDVTGG